MTGKEINAWAQVAAAGVLAIAIGTGFILQFSHAEANRRMLESMITNQEALITETQREVGSNRELMMRNAMDISELKAENVRQWDRILTLLPPTESNEVRGERD